MQRNILITGGAGFIGSHVVRRFVTKYPHYRIINLDALTYAGNLENLRDVENAPNYTFVKADICDAEAVRKVFTEHAIDGVIHLAAESHVDRSITDPMAFVRHERHSARSPCSMLRGRLGKGFRRQALLPCEHRRGLRLAPRRQPLPGDHALRPAEPVQRQQGRQRPLRSRLWQHVQAALRAHAIAATITAATTSRRS